MGNTVALGREDRHKVMACELGADLITIIGLIHDGLGQMMLRGSWGKDSLKHGARMPLTFREHQSDPMTFIYAAGMN